MAFFSVKLLPYTCSLFSLQTAVIKLQSGNLFPKPWISIFIKSFDSPGLSNIPSPNPARLQKVPVNCSFCTSKNELNITACGNETLHSQMPLYSTFSMKYVSGSLPRGTGGSQLSTTYVLLISEACTLVGGPGTWISPGRVISIASVKQRINLRVSSCYSSSFWPPTLQHNLSYDIILAVHLLTTIPFWGIELVIYFSFYFSVKVKYVPDKLCICHTFFLFHHIWITFICWAECLGKICSYMQIRYIFWSKAEAQCVNIRTSTRGYLQKKEQEGETQLKTKWKAGKERELITCDGITSQPKACLKTVEPFGDSTSWSGLTKPSPFLLCRATRKLRQDLHAQFQAKGIQHGSSCPLSPSTAWEEASFHASGIIVL